MSKLIFPQVLENITDDRYINTEERYIYQYPIIMEYLRKKILGKSILDFYLDKKKIEGICLYAVTEFTELVVDDLKNNYTDIMLYLCDKRAENFTNGYMGITVIDMVKLKELYDKGIIKSVLNCSIFHRNTIYRELMNIGIKLEDIYSVIEVICTGL